MTKTVQKIMALTLGLGVAGMATGCAVDEDLASSESAFTRIDTGACATYLQIAAEIVRTAMVDLGRYRPGLDLVRKDGKVTLTAGGEARCVTRGGCPRLKSLLSYQSLTNVQTDALGVEFPYMLGLQTGMIANSLSSSLSDYQNPNPNAIMSHELTFDHTSPAAPLANCAADLKYHCFSVTGLPAGQTVTTLATQIHTLFASSNTDLANMTRVFAENGYLCIDPDGTGDDQTGGGSTGGSTCVDGAMAISFDAAFVGNCCTLASGNGYLVQNAVNPAYMSCKVADLASAQPVTVSSELATNPAANVTDASVDSLWMASTTAVNQWARVDLSTAQSVNKTISGVAFKLEQPGAYGYKVETSTNNVIWGVKKTGTTAATATWQDAVFPSVSVRYVRVTFTSLPATRSAALGSLRVF